MGNNSQPQGLLLDAMGTLISLRSSVGTTYAAFAADHGIAVEAEAIDAVFPDLFRAAPPMAFPGLSGSALLEAEQNWWSTLIASCLENCGHQQPMPAALGETLFHHYASASAWQVYSDVAEYLPRWHVRGIKLAVVSNFDQRLIPLLEQLGLAELMDAVVVSSMVGAAKPDPLPFRCALEQLHLKASDVWHIGDSPADEVGAAAAGVRCLLIRRSQRSAGPSPA